MKLEAVALSCVSCAERRQLQVSWHTSSIIVVYLFWHFGCVLLSKAEVRGIERSNEEQHFGM